MTQASHAGAAGNFAQLTSELTRLESGIANLKAQRRTQLEALRALLVARQARHRELFAGLKSFSEDDDQNIDPRYDHLEHWEIEGDVLYASFEYSFRGERNGYSIRIPVRYLAEDGEATMEAEAASANAEKETQARRRAEAAAQAERAHLEELMRKHPDVVAASQKGQQ